ncbi:TadE/TadG family type IV pilus assembly protein [Sphingomonas sp.]|jgi:Flp pilus assembly protein TadG|uniref:TadE/TadG family type IV pilus assembly protein n=1 Tax=Sphingomonas sp. TaxID=28214 RepID=UPI0025F060A9|nr:TadE/TadG family type IV pilus assembly protein [Sphingomonas sp.]
MRAMLRRLRHDVRGATILEFALVAPVVLLLLLGLMDLSYRLYVQSILAGAVQRAGRLASLETGPAALNNIDSAVVGSITAIAPGATWQSSRKSFGDYSKIGPERFNDANNNGVRDSDECYSDVNGNSRWDADPGRTGQGGASDTVLYTMTITYPSILPIAYFFGGSNSIQATATTVLKNQPYSTQNAITPVTICT